MAKVKVTNISLQVLNLLVKEGKDNKNVQLLSKQDMVIDRQQLTDQIKRLNDQGHVTITPYTESITL